MTLTSSLTLFGSMVILAFIPGPGTLAVVARTLTFGIRQGASTVVGIVAGDFVFITLALLGLAALSELLGSFFAFIKYLGAGYLIWLGISVALAQSSNSQVRPIREASHLASFSAGLLTTLSNPKAILFYLSFFPAFMDLSEISVLDTTIIFAIATTAVGGVMLGYAYAAHKASHSLHLTRSGLLLRYCSGALLIISGVFLAIKG